MYGDNGSSYADGLRTGDFVLPGDKGISRGMPTNNAIFWSGTLKDWTLYTPFPLSTPVVLSGVNVLNYVPLFNKEQTGYARLVYFNNQIALEFDTPVMLVVNQPSSLGALLVSASGYDMYGNKMMSVGLSNDGDTFVTRPFKWLTSLGIAATVAGSNYTVQVVNTYEIPYTDYGWMSPIITVNGAYYAERNSAGTGTPANIRMNQGDFNQAQFNSGTPNIAYFYARWGNNLDEADGLVRPVLFFGPNALPTGGVNIAGISAVYGYGETPYFPPDLVENGNAPTITKTAPIVGVATNSTSYPAYSDAGNTCNPKYPIVSNENIIGKPQYAGDSSTPWVGWRG